MLFPMKKLIFAFTFNCSLFLILIIGIQNSSNRKKVNLIIAKTINTPISFIIGVSFIGGSLVGNIIDWNFREKKR